MFSNQIYNYPLMYKTYLLYIGSMSELKPEDLDISALSVFRMVVEEGGFSRASKKLLRTQPAVSLAVRKLEDQIGYTLIDRTSRKLVLTDAGQVALGYAKGFDVQKRKLVDELEELRNLSAGRLSVGANESSILYLLRHLRRYRWLYPKIRLQVQRSRSSQIPNKILQGHLELGVISYDPMDGLLETEVIYTDHLAFVVSPKHRLATEDSVSIKDLGGETFIAHNVVSPYRRIVMSRFQEHGVPLRMDVEMPTIESIRKLVQADEGVAFLPRMCVGHEIRQETLCEVRVKEIEVERPIRLVYPKKRSLSRAGQAFLELVSGRAAKSPTIGQGTGS